MLDRCGVEIGANPCQHALALVAFVVEYADLDQLVRREVDVDFVQHRSSETVGADAHHGLQVMRFRAKRSALRRC